MKEEKKAEVLPDDDDDVFIKFIPNCLISHLVNALFFSPDLLVVTTIIKKK